MFSTKFLTARSDCRRSAQALATHSFAPRGVLTGCLTFVLIACSSSSPSHSGGSGGNGSGGAGGNGSGGNGAGGSSARGGSGGNGSGGSGAGGSSVKGGAGGNGSGGSSVKGGSGGNSGGAGGSNAGGNNAGGSNAGGSNAGGSNAGGSNAGGSNAGGSNAGGNNAGGNNAGGNNAGGNNAGSNNAGGTSAGGSSAGGSSAGGSSAGGSNAGGTGAGGTGGGGSTGTAADLKCTDPVYGSVSIPGIQVISDFENSSLFQYVQDGRGQDALPWYAYAKGDTNDSTTNIMTTPGPLNPLYSSNKFAVDTSVHGPCSLKGALHVTSPGPAADGEYVGFGIDFMARPGTAKKKLAYDGSKYTGVGYWAKCSGDLQFAYSKVVDAAQDADIDTSIVSTPCSYSSGTICNQYGVKNTVITKDWTYYKLYFSELLQDPNGTTFTSGIDPKKLVAFQIHINPFSPRSGSPTTNPIDCYVDDVHFLTEAAPSTPSDTVTWSVSGNKIQRNGKDYRIRGLVRSSFEWDCAGFGINREDAQRIKTWHPNAVRLPVMDTLWAGASTGNTTCNGGAYQRQVKRAISWLLQQGMDVILDLHYVGGTPSSSNATFWDSISKDSFFKDGRIIFELFNEPTADIGSLRTWMNSTIATIRGNGAKNLILVSGTDYSFDISGYVSSPVTDSANTVAYVTHPYIFKTTSEDTAYLTPAKTLPVIATEFGDANVSSIGHTISPTQCDASIYSNYMSKFETAGISWTAWAWIVDEWGCGFPQMISDYSGTPNAIGTPVKQQLTSLNP